MQEGLQPRNLGHGPGSRTGWITSADISEGNFGRLEIVRRKRGYAGGLPAMERRS